MEPRSSSARRYAEAAFEIALRDGTLDQWLEQLERAAVVTSEGRASHSLEDPAVPFDARADALLSAMGPNVLPQVRNILLLVLRRRRVATLPRISREFRRLYNRRAGVTEATATSAAPLPPDEVEALRRRLEAIAGGRIELQLNTDPSLLGGIQVRLGDTLIDGSVRGRLERLRSRLAAGA